MVTSAVDMDGSFNRSRLIGNMPLMMVSFAVLSQTVVQASRCVSGAAH